MSSLNTCTNCPILSLQNILIDNSNFSEPYDIILIYPSICVDNLPVPKDTFLSILLDPYLNFKLHITQPWVKNSQFSLPHVRS
jgi:hypothetical protein